MFVFLSSLVGLCLGSFVAAATYRYQRGLDFVQGRSFCDCCKKDLPWYVNVPILSYIFLFGKTLCCRQKLSIRYPLIEFAGLSIGYFSTNYIEFVAGFLLLAIFVIDIESMIIPDELVYSLLLLSVIGSMLSYSSVFAGFALATFLLLIHLVTLGRGMGLGDVKFAIFPGIVLGLNKGFVWMFISFLTGAVVASILLLSKKAKLKQKIAFGPFLIIGFVIVYTYGEKIIKWLYLN